MHYKPTPQEPPSNEDVENGPHQALFFKAQSSDALLDNTLQEALKKAWFY